MAGRRLEERPAGSRSATVTNRPKPEPATSTPRRRVMRGGWASGWDVRVVPCLASSYGHPSGRRAAVDLAEDSKNARGVGRGSGDPSTRSNQKGAIPEVAASWNASARKDVPDEVAQRGQALAAPRPGSRGGRPAWRRWRECGPSRRSREPSRVRVGRWASGLASLAQDISPGLRRAWNRRTVAWRRVSRGPGRTPTHRGSCQ